MCREVCLLSESNIRFLLMELSIVNICIRFVVLFEPLTLGDMVFRLA